MVILNKRGIMMTRTILTTCGTSLLQSSCWEYKGLNEASFSTMSAIDKKEHELKCMDVHEDAKHDKPDLYDRFDPKFWEDIKYLRYLPAELASLRAIQICFENDEKSYPLEKGDEIKLLHSTNDYGIYCAEMLLKVIKMKELLPDVDVKLLPVEGLDPSNAGELGKALRNIWGKCVEIWEGDNNEKDNKKYIFNLTGGYKNVATLFGGAAYFIGNVQIFYLHEDTNFNEISIMGFNKDAEFKKRLCTGSFDIIKRKFDQTPGMITAIE